MRVCKRVVVSAFVTSNVYYINHPNLSPCGIAAIWIASINVQHTHTSLCFNFTTATTTTQDRNYKSHSIFSVCTKQSLC